MLIVVNYKFSTVLPQNHRLFTCLHCMQGSFALAPCTGSNTPYRKCSGQAQPFWQVLFGLVHFISYNF